MEINYKLVLGIAVFLIILGAIFLLLYFTNKKFNKFKEKEREKYSKLLSQKKSSEVRLGQISENLAPFLKEFKYNPKETHFMGMPIDYIVFEEDRIIFLEIKSGKSQLSSKQRRIKKLIKEGKVEWDIMRID